MKDSLGGTVKRTMSTKAHCVQQVEHDFALIMCSRAAEVRRVFTMVGLYFYAFSVSDRSMFCISHRGA